MPVWILSPAKSNACDAVKFHSIFLFARNDRMQSMFCGGASCVEACTHHRCHRTELHDPVDTQAKHFAHANRINLMKRYRADQCEAHGNDSSEQPELHGSGLTPRPGNKTYRRDPAGESE